MLSRLREKLRWTRALKLSSESEVYPSTGKPNKAEELIDRILRFEDEMFFLFMDAEPLLRRASVEPAISVPLSPQHVIDVLRRLQNGEIRGFRVEAWASLVEQLVTEVHRAPIDPKLYQIICELLDCGLRGFALTPETADYYIDRCARLMFKFCDDGDS